MSRVLEEISAAIGMTPAVRLARAYGGRTLRVPSAVDETHPLAVLLGLEAALGLSREFAGCALDIPTERTALIALRDAAIVQAHDNKTSVHQLSRDHQLSRKMIRKILARARQ